MTPTQYVALALRRGPRIFLDIHPRTRESQISMVLVSVGLASLAQLLVNIYTVGAIKKVPVPYSCYDLKTLRSVKCYDPITVQIVITVVLFTP